MSSPDPDPGQRSSGGVPAAATFQRPTGTRDFYPADLNRLRYIQDAWRRTSINHGFEEIDGPAFEHLDLYTAKSGEGIVSELFSFERFGGEKTFALRPEFTPTLARMYAARAASLPKPTKWFWQQNCYRAERPQRGRLREFCQWNCDIIGTDSPTNDPEALARADAEVIACCVGMLEGVGLTPADVRIELNDRQLLASALRSTGVAEDNLSAAMALLDKRGRVNLDQFNRDAERIGLSIIRLVQALDLVDVFLKEFGSSKRKNSAAASILAKGSLCVDPILALWIELDRMDILPFCSFSSSLARGLAYYTGMVFEVHEASGAERAIAGGGRYDKLIETFGGPPTPAVGFGMGDVVLSLVLKDKGLLPADDEIARRLGLAPDAVVVSNGTPEADAAAPGVVATLRRAGLHARRSTKKIGKAIQDAAKAGARFCVILESATGATVKNMATQAQEACPVADLPARLGRGNEPGTK